MQGNDSRQWKNSEAKQGLVQRAWSLAGEIKGEDRVTGTQGPGSMASLGDTATEEKNSYGRGKGGNVHRFSSPSAL